MKGRSRLSENGVLTPFDELMEIVLIFIQNYFIKVLKYPGNHPIKIV